MPRSRQDNTNSTTSTLLPSLYIPYTDPAKWASFGDQVTATRLKDRNTTSKFWISQRETVDKSLRHLKASEQLAVIGRMNTCSFGNLAAVATRCRFPTIRRMYQQTLRRVLGLLFIMVEMVRQRVAKPMLLGSFHYGGPVKEMLAASPKTSRPKKTRSKSSASSTRSKPSQKHVQQVKKTCEAIMKWSVADGFNPIL
jgi:hypothetical protein